MDSLRKEIEEELKRTRIDKSRIYYAITKLIDQVELGGSGSGSEGPAGPAGPPGPAGRAAHATPCTLRHSGGSEGMPTAPSRCAVTGRAGDPASSRTVENVERSRQSDSDSRVGVCVRI